VTFGDRLTHYEDHELDDQTDIAIPKSQTTIEAYRRYIKPRIQPQWTNRVALSIKPLEASRGAGTQAGARAFKPIHGENRERDEARL
jgi:hypothetical protein